LSLLWSESGMSLSLLEKDSGLHAATVCRGLQFSFLLEWKSLHYSDLANRTGRQTWKATPYTKTYKNNWFKCLIGLKIEIHSVNLWFLKVLRLELR
jgi:hypothetical protein